MKETLKLNVTLGMDFRQRDDKRSDEKSTKSTPVPSVVAFKVYRQSRQMVTSLTSLSEKEILGPKRSLT